MKKLRIIWCSFILISFTTCTNYTVIQRSYITESIDENKNVSCFIEVYYPQVHNLKDLEIQNQINERIKTEFIGNEVENCNGIDEQVSITKIEKSYTLCITGDLMSIMSNEIFSSNVVAGNTAISYNLDLVSGQFLGLSDIFYVQYSDEITQIVLDEIFASYGKDKDAEMMYNYYSSIRQDVFYKLQVQLCKDVVIFVFKGTAEVEPLYKAEIPKKLIEDFINNKYS